MVGGNEHNDIESRTGGFGYDNRAEIPIYNETWWWNDKAQEVITAKKEARNTWGTSGRQYDIDNYMQSNKAAKKAVAIAKARAMNELYEELESPEGERKISRIVKAGYKTTNEFTKNNQIKDEQV